MLKVSKYVIIDILKSRIVLAYTMCLLILSFSLFSLEDNVSKGMLSLLNINLILVPLVCLTFSTIYIYNSSEFIELLLAQPIHRIRLLLSIYCGLAISLLLAFIIGVGLPVLIMAYSPTAIFMVAGGSFLTMIFVSLAFLTSVLARDKAKGIGVAIILWLFFSLLYDGLLLFLMFQLSDYPLENLMIGLSSLNPVDLARILILLKMDSAALMGYSGAVFNNFFGANHGLIYSLCLLAVWIIWPLLITMRKFKIKDL